MLKTYSNQCQQNCIKKQTRNKLKNKKYSKLLHTTLIFLCVTAVFLANFLFADAFKINFYYAKTMLPL